MKSFLIFLSRNRLYTAIEFIGLAVSLSFVILIGSFVWQQYAVTRENPCRESLYVPGTPVTPGLSFGFPDIITGIPEIETVARLCRVGSTFEGNESVFCAAVDRSFFDLLPCYHFLEGSADALSTISNVIVSESFARKHDLSLGEKVEINWSDFIVGAIVQDTQGTVMKDYDIFQASEIYKDEIEPFDNIGSTLCFIKVLPGTDPGVLYDKLEAACKEVYPDVYGQRRFDHLELYRYDELFFKETGRHFRHGDLKTIRTLLLVGLLLLLSSIFNYINLSVALTGKRAKEMAVRQLHGASRGNIVGKYICESILFTAVCFAAGLLLADAFCPMLNRLLNNPTVPVRIVWSVDYIIAYVGIIVMVGAICGVIPAMMAGKDKALEVMKGGYRRKTKMIFSKIFIVLQNALAVVLIACSLTMEAQMRKTQNRPMHCNIEDKVYLSFFAWEDTTPLKDALESLPFVKAVGTCNGVPGNAPLGLIGTTRDGEDIYYCHFKMDSTAFKMFDFEILEDYNAPLFNSVWFSDESFAASGFDGDYHDIGVLSQSAEGCDQLAGIFKAFPTNSANMGEEEHIIISVVRMQSDSFSAGDFVIGTTGDRKEAYEKIMETYEAYAKDRDVSLFSCVWIDENIAQFWRPARNNMRMVEIFMLLSILISLLGLLAMSAYYADEKSRDIAVRKVFGGTVDTETWRTILDYMVLVVAACLIGIPIAIYIAQEYLKSFIYRLEDYWWIFVVAVGLSVVFAFASVLWQTLKAARTNPAFELKKE